MNQPSTGPRNSNYAQKWWDSRSDLGFGHLSTSVFCHGERVCSLGHWAPIRSVSEKERNAFCWRLENDQPAKFWPFAALTNSQDEICWSVAAPKFGAFHVFVGAQLSRGANHPATPEELLGGAPSDASLADSDTSRSVPQLEIALTSQFRTLNALKLCGWFQFSSACQIPLWWNPRISMSKKKHSVPLKPSCAAVTGASPSSGGNTKCTSVVCRLPEEGATRKAHLITRPHQGRTRAPGQSNTSVHWISFGFQQILVFVEK